MAEDMFDAGADASPASIHGFLLNLQRGVSISFVLIPRAQLAALELGFDLLRARGGIGPHVTSCGLGLQDFFEDLTVMHRSVGDCIAPNEFVLLIHIHMILIAIVIHSMKREFESMPYQKKIGQGCFTFI